MQRQMSAETTISEMEGVSLVARRKFDAQHHDPIPEIPRRTKKKEKRYVVSVLICLP